MSELLQNIREIKIPSTHKSLDEENRILDIKHDHDELMMKYSSTGLEIADKRFIEDSVYGIASSYNLSDENVSIYSINEENDHKPKQESANLKVGHGQIGQKKKLQDVKKVIANRSHTRRLQSKIISACTISSPA